MAENKPFQNFQLIQGLMPSSILFCERLKVFLGLKLGLGDDFESFLLIGAYLGWFMGDSPAVFGFVVESHEALVLANFKYKLEPISDSEVNTVPKAAKKKAKKTAKKK
jgi:hypothetical protein